MHISNWWRAYIGGTFPKATDGTVVLIKRAIRKEPSMNETNKENNLLLNTLRLPPRPKRVLNEKRNWNCRSFWALPMVMAPVGHPFPH